MTTWREAVFQPTSFFQRMPREDGFGAVLMYYLVLGVIVAGINLFWSSLFDFAGLGALFLPDMPTTSINAIVEFLLSPLLLIVVLYVVSGVCHLLLLMVAGAKHEFGTTTRVFAFSYSPAVFAIVPILGNLVALVWMTVIAIIGLREAQQTSRGKAAFAVLFPLVLLVVLGVMVAIIAVFAGVLGTRL
ncbi:MAG: YIP1 family protein [Gemmatimonadota bacterium]